MCVCEFRILINNNNLTHKAATTNKEFFKQISSAPYVHAIFKHQRTRPVIVFVAYTRQYKDAIHDQDYGEHHLNEEKSLFQGLFFFLVCNKNFKLLTHMCDSVNLMLHGLYFKFVKRYFFQAFLLTCMRFLLISQKRN